MLYSNVSTKTVKTFDKKAFHQSSRVKWLLSLHIQLSRGVPVYFSAVGYLPVDGEAVINCTIK